MKRRLNIASRIFISLLLFALPLVQVSSATLTTGSVTITDSRPTTTSVTYTIQFSNVSLSAIQCINVKFSDAATGGSKPTGMNITAAAFGGTSNYVPTPANWTISNNNTTGVSSITYGTGETPASASSRTVILTGITNGSTAGTTYYVQFSTFNNTDCATSPVDSATIAYIYTAGQVVTATVDPTLSFTISAVSNGQPVNGVNTTVTTTSSTVPLGTLSTGANSIAAQDLYVGTNANGGYTVTARYTGQLASGSHNFTNHGGSNGTPTPFSAAGTESFGYTTSDYSLGTGSANRFQGGNWAAFTTSPLEVLYSATAAAETLRFGYQAGISATTPAGIYTTTVVFVATPTY